MRTAGSYRLTSVIVLTGAMATIGGRISSAVGEIQNGERLTAVRVNDAAPPISFDCGYQSPEKAVAAIHEAVRRGEIADPSKKALPPLGGGVALTDRPPCSSTPTVADIFLFQDTARVLLTSFSNGQLFDLMTSGANAVIAANGDNYDFIAFWVNFVPNHQLGAAFYLGLFNDVSGIGNTPYNNRASFGLASTEVEGYVMMWNIDTGYWQPGTVGNSASFTRLVLAQEFEHRFGMFLPNLIGGRRLQGDDVACGRSAHWNFKVDGQGSGMEIREWVGASPAVLGGNCVSFAGEECFNTDTGGVWSHADLYLMGYDSPAEMDAGNSQLRYMNTSCASPYNGGVSTFSSADIVASAGPRNPSSSTAQKNFRAAWVMIHQPGAPPTPAQLNKAVGILSQQSTDWNFSTLGRGTLCNVLHFGPPVKFSQPPDSAGEDVPSNIDWTDMAPNDVVADDFVSDGRPITGVQWWGSKLDGTTQPDGWLISFHEPLSIPGTPGKPLGLYFCDPATVSVGSTPLTACDAHPFLEYSVDLIDCCLVHADSDSRSTLTPAQGDAFHEQQCFAYDMDIQAVMGHKFVDVAGVCTEVLTGNKATVDFWGWHTTGMERGLRPALQSVVSMSGSDWLYGPWSPVAPTCSSPNMAFQLLTNDPSASADCNDNGVPDMCESLPDCQPNNVLDECDLADGNSQDCNGNTVPDECDIASGAPDCQPNGFPDECDNESVASLTSAIAAVLGFVDISGTGVPLSLADDAAIDVTMPFTPAGFGGPTISVCNNGGVGLVPGTQLGAVDNWPLPHVNAFGGNAGMLAYWDDLDSTTGNVYYKTIGATPSQTFIVQWHNRPHYAGDAVLDGDEVTFQIQIFETPVSGIVAQYLYADTNFLNAGLNDGASATVGYQRSATSAIQWSLDTAGAVTPGVVLSLRRGDLNGNGQPDECDPPAPASAGPPDRNRFIGLSMPATTVSAAAATALRVSLVDLQNPVPANLTQYPPPDFSSYEVATCSAVGEANGCVRWVGKPGTFYEFRGPPPSGLLRAARLQCTPHYQDWTTEGVFYVTGAEIVPSSIYDVHSFAAGCAGMEETCIDFSVPLRLATARSGDVEAPFQAPPPASLSQPNAIDVAQLVNKIKNVPGALSKARAQLQTNLPELNADVNTLDLVAVVDALKFVAYAFPGPCSCPSTVPCGPALGSVACPSGPAACVSAFGTGAMCVKTCTGGANDGEPCVTAAHCPGDGVCENPFCRDACGRCTPP